MQYYVFIWFSIIHHHDLIKFEIDINNNEFYWKPYENIKKIKNSCLSLVVRCSMELKLVPILFTHRNRIKNTRLWVMGLILFIKKINSGSSFDPGNQTRFQCGHY